MNECASSTEPAQPGSPDASAPDPRLLVEYCRGWVDGHRAGAVDLLSELTGEERATLLRQVSTPKE